MSLVPYSTACLTSSSLQIIKARICLSVSFDSNSTSSSISSSLPHSGMFHSFLIISFMIVHLFVVRLFCVVLLSFVLVLRFRLVSLVFLAF